MKKRRIDGNRAVESVDGVVEVGAVIEGNFVSVHDENLDEAGTDVREVESPMNFENVVNSADSESLSEETRASEEAASQSDDISKNEDVSGVPSEGVGEENTIEEVRKSRRPHGAGSVWKMSDGKYGFCIQLTKDRGLKELWGNKLRHLGTGADLEEAERKCRESLERKDELLKLKLEKLGHKFDDVSGDVAEDTKGHEVSGDIENQV